VCEDWATDRSCRVLVTDEAIAKYITVDLSEDAAFAKGVAIRQYVLAAETIKTSDCQADGAIPDSQSQGLCWMMEQRKGMRGMPRHSTAMKDAVSCEKRGGTANTY
jgi:hypothetical protein